MRSSTSSARSTAVPLTSASRCAARASRRWYLSSRPGCAQNMAGSRATAMSPRRCWDTFTRFLKDGRICLTNNAAERALPRIALGRKSWLFAGSDRGGERDVDPQAWLADVLARINDHNIQKLDALLPWNW